MSKRTFVTSKLVPIFICLTFAGCASASGSTVTPDEAVLSKIRSVSIVVNQNEKFSVRLYREQTGIAFHFGNLGLMVYGFEAAYRNASDVAIEEKFEPIVGNYDPSKVLSSKLEEQFFKAHIFDKVAQINSLSESQLKERQGDGILEVTLEQWGLRLCSDYRSDEKVQFGVVATTKLFSPQDRKIIWEWNDLYLDEKCHAVSEFQSRDGLLKLVILRALDNYAGRVANEIAFPFNLTYPDGPFKKSPLSTIKPMKISLHLKDLRAMEEKDVVGGMKWLGLSAQKTRGSDINLVLYEALKTELEGNGHIVTNSAGSQSDATIEVRLKQYWVDTRQHLFEEEMIGAISIDVTILDPQNEAIFGRRPISGISQGTRSFSRFPTEEIILNRALNNLIRSFSRDPSILEYLLLVNTETNKR